MNFNDFSPLMEHISSTLIFLNINYTSIGEASNTYSENKSIHSSLFQKWIYKLYTYSWYKLFTINTFKV